MMQPHFATLAAQARVVVHRRLGISFVKRGKDAFTKARAFRLATIPRRPSALDNASR